MGKAAEQPRAFYTKPPFNTLLSIAAALEAFFITLPIHFVLFALRRNARPHPQWSLYRSLLVSVIRSFRARASPLLIHSASIDKRVLPRLLLRWYDATPIWITPIDPETDLQGDLKAMFDAASSTVLSRNIVYWYGGNHAGKRSRRAKEGERVILFYHGGGMWEQNATPINPTINCLRILLAACARSTKGNAPTRALAVEYRLCDDSAYPGILADALSGWKYLIDLGFEPKDIIIAGDSAGGTLALALTRYISIHRPFYSRWKRNERVADGLILFSPWVDVTMSYCMSSGYRNARSDYLNPALFKKILGPLLDGLASDAASNPLVSFLCKARQVTDDDFDGFPRALIFGG